ncbi:MAG TPA: hypothetical protein VH062_10740 [Polyangiaceae bacterium]|jgi:hypothetical protein|nr:hypothetical protein [Polyangiaceae bacterium]
MSVRRRSLGPRDQHASVFSASLLRFCDAVGAVGAALVDAEGETVDYAGSIDPFDIKVAAAEWAVVFARLRACRAPELAETVTLRVRAARKSFIVTALSNDYALVVRLLPHAFGVSTRAMNEAIREVSLEAGLPLTVAALRDKEHWARIDVRCEKDNARRPDAIWVSGTWLPVDVLGHWLVEKGSRELGFRVRLASGAELTLLRERLGRWYAEAPLPF